MKRVNKKVEIRDVETKKNLLQLNSLSKLEREATKPTAKIYKAGDRITLQQK